MDTNENLNEKWGLHKVAPDLGVYLFMTEEEIVMGNDWVRENLYSRIKKNSLAKAVADDFKRHFEKV